MAFQARKDTLVTDCRGARLTNFLLEDVVEGTERDAYS